MWTLPSRCPPSRWGGGAACPRPRPPARRRGPPRLQAEAEVWHLSKSGRVVGGCEARLRQVLAHLVHVDLEGRREVDVAWVITAEVDVHEPRHEPLLRSVTIE